MGESSIATLRIGFESLVRLAGLEVRDMKFRTLVTVLSFGVCVLITSAQDTKFFREKLGKPSELYHKSGIDIRVDYDDEGQVCSILVSDPARRSVGSLRTIVDELVPWSSRGSMIKTSHNIGDCINVTSAEYEKVFIIETEDA